MLDGGVVEVGHENYGTGPKGGLIALISNPTNGLDVFPSWKAKAVRIFKKDKKGRIPSDILVAGQVMGDAAGDKGMAGDRVSLETSPAELLAAKLRYAFPGVTVKSTKEEFNEAIKKEGVKTRESGGNIIYGFTKDGDVFLNPDAESLATPIHEFGHIWVDYLRSKSSGIKGSKLLERGLKLVEGTKELAEAIEIYGDNNLAREEALVELMATKGVTIINAAQKVKFIEWLNGVFKYIKAKFTNTQELFKIEQIKEITRNKNKEIIEINSNKNKQSQAEKEIAIEQVKKKAKEEIENVENSINEKINKMSLDEFINTALADLFKGKDVDLKGKFDPSESTEAARARMRMDFKDSNKSMQTIISEARENNFTDAAIKDYLTRVRKFKAKEVNEAMEAKADLFIELPDSFKNIKGGIKAGQELFNKVSRFRAKEVRNNNKRKNKISEQEIVDRTIEFMEAQPEFIAEGDTYTVGSEKKGTKVTKTKKSPSSQQIEMLSDLQESVGTTVDGQVGVRPTKNMQEKIRKARLMLTQRKKGLEMLAQLKQS